jgi:hypothetical protein
MDGRIIFKSILNKCTCDGVDAIHLLRISTSEGLDLLSKIIYPPIPYCRAQQLWTSHEGLAEQVHVEIEL